MNKSNNYGQDLENAEISFSKMPSFVEDTASKTGRSETVTNYKIFYFTLPKNQDKRKK